MTAQLKELQVVSKDEEKEELLREKALREKAEKKNEELREKLYWQAFANRQAGIVEPGVYSYLRENGDYDDDAFENGEFCYVCTAPIEFGCPCSNM